MKLINPGTPMVIMRWSEFSKLLVKLPRDEWVHYLHEAGIYDQKTINQLMLYDDEKLLSKIFCEMEENL